MGRLGNDFAKLHLARCGFVFAFLVGLRFKLTRKALGKLKRARLQQPKCPWTSGRGRLIVAQA